MNYKQIYAIEHANKQRILKSNPTVPDSSGIYILTREENGFKYAYIGQARHILSRLFGRLTKDIEVKQTKSGVSFAGFSVAVQRNFKNANGEHDTDFFDCIAWRATAENLAKYFHKGNRILIDGELQTQNFEKDGKKITKVVVVVNGFDFVEKSDGATPAKKVKAEEMEQMKVTDDLPF